MFESVVKHKESPSAVRKKSSASAHPARAPSRATVHLSKLIGNGKIQPKLKIGEADNQYEREADRMAERVLRAPVGAAAAGVAPSASPTVHVVPTAPAPIPIPYPEIGRDDNSKKSPKQVKISGKKVGLTVNSYFSSSHGDEAGATQKGMVRSASVLSAGPVQTDNQPVPESDLQRQSLEEDDGAVQPLALQRQPEAEDEETPVQLKGDGLQAQVPSAVEASIRASKGGGAALPANVQGSMENHFGTDFSAVRIHNDNSSVQMSRSIGAQALTHGSDIYFNSGKYQPESSSGQRLLAHELTHVVQQGAVPQQGLQLQSAPEQVQRFGGAVRTQLSALVRTLPGYRLLTRIAGVDPISNVALPISAGQLVDRLLGLVASGPALFRRIVGLGIVGRAVTFVRGELARFNLTAARLRQMVQSARAEMDFFRVDPFLFNLRVLRRHVGALLADVRSFARSLVRQLLVLVKQALLPRLSRFAQQLPGFYLLTVVLGHHPFTGAPVLRTPINLIQGFLAFVPGGRRKFRDLVESGALDRAFNWISGRLRKFLDIRASLRAVFEQLWRSLTISDILDPMGVFSRAINLLRFPVWRMISFSAEVGREVLRFIFEGVMGRGSRVLALLLRLGAGFMMIVRNPIGFLRNLVSSVRGGFLRFSRNIVQHLRSGLRRWFSHVLRRARVTPPSRFNARGIITLVLRMLGIGPRRIRARLRRRFGRRLLAVLQRKVVALRRLIVFGPMTVWRSIRRAVGDLRHRIFGPLRSFVVTRIVRAAVARLVGLFNPAGASISAIRAIYGAINFFIERIGQIGRLAGTVIASLARIASGAASAAAGFFERSMASSIPPIISFLARFVGVGGIFPRIQRIFGRVRRPVDRVINNIVSSQVRKVGGWLGTERERTPGFKFKADGQRSSLHGEPERLEKRG